MTIQNTQPFRAWSISSSHTKHYLEEYSGSWPFYWWQFLDSTGVYNLMLTGKISLFWQQSLQQLTTLDLWAHFIQIKFFYQNKTEIISCLLNMIGLKKYCKKFVKHTKSSTPKLFRRSIWNEITIVLQLNLKHIQGLRSKLENIILIQNMS